MRRISIFVALVMFGLFMSSLSAQDKHHLKADYSVRKVFEKYEGISLENAVRKDIILKNGGRDDYANIMVQFNGGGSRNKLYPGEYNILEILVENYEPVQAVTLGFEFYCPAGLSGFVWDTTYGSIPDSATPSNIVRIHEEPFQGQSIWDGNLADVSKFPDSILLGGIEIFPPLEGLPINSYPVVLYSMRIYVPDDSNLIGETFYIDNIKFSENTEWCFIDFNSSTYAPRFQGVINSSPSNPDAPPVSFGFSSQRCQLTSRSSHSDAAKAIMEVASPVDWKTVELNADKSGNNIISLRIALDNEIQSYEENVSELEELGISVFKLRSTQRAVYGDLPLKILPQVCQLQGIRRITFPARYEHRYPTRIEGFKV